MTYDINLRFDSSGVLREPELHDGFLQGIVVSKDGNAKLIVASVIGEQFVIALTGVKQLRAQDFREGNIIFDIVLFKLQSCPREVLQQFYDCDEDYQSQALPEKIRQAKENEGCHVLEISPSYGCSFVALFKDISITYEK